MDKESRLGGLEKWKKEQNGELKLIRRKGSATLIAIILLLVGVIFDLTTERTLPAQDIPTEVETAIEEQLPAMIESIVHQVLDSTSTP